MNAWHQDWLRARRPASTEADGEVDFRCNICGRNTRAPLSAVSDRETPACPHCQSSLRMRALIRALSLELFGKSLTLREFPRNKKILGLGMSDWDGYALPLAAKLGYTNTYYHQAPRLDITDITGWQEDRYDFIVSSDVLEHVPPPVSIAFQNVGRLLKPGGLLVLTVPFTKTGTTQEHFADLHDYRFFRYAEEQILINRTRDGREQVFGKLVFHGGDGFTLEMRLFSEPSLVRALEEAGFEHIRVHTEDQPDIGVIWPFSWAVPVTARKKR